MTLWLELALTALGCLIAASAVFITAAIVDDGEWRARWR
jgi:hypothetical protein